MRNYLLCVVFLFTALIPWRIRRSGRASEKTDCICRIMIWVILTVGVTGLLACYGRQYFLKSQTLQDVPEIDSELVKYMAFSDSSSLTRLDEEPEIFFTEDFPVLNGTADFFPLYSSIINMVYPDTIGELNSEGSPYRYTSSAGAFLELIEGKTDIVFSAMPDESVFEAAKEQNLTLKFYEIAADAFVFMNSTTNPVDSLSESQVRDIFSGDISNWSALGGDDEEILVYQGEKTSRIHSMLEQFMDGRPLTETESSLSLENGELEETNSSYINSSGAIGCTFYSLTHGIEEDKGVRFLCLNGVTPDKDSVADGEYMICDKVYCITIEERENYNSRILINWLMSDQGKRLLREAGFISGS